MRGDAAEVVLLGLGDPELVPRRLDVLGHVGEVQVEQLPGVPAAVGHVDGQVDVKEAGHGFDFLISLSLGRFGQAPDLGQEAAPVAGSSLHHPAIQSYNELMENARGKKLDRKKWARQDSNCSRPLQAESRGILGPRARLLTSSKAAIAPGTNPIRLAYGAEPLLPPAKTNPFLAQWIAVSCVILSFISV